MSRVAAAAVLTTECRGTVEHSTSHYASLLGRTKAEKAQPRPPSLEASSPRPVVRSLGRTESGLGGRALSARHGALQPGRRRTTDSLTHSLETQCAAAAAADHSAPNDCLPTLPTAGGWSTSISSSSSSPFTRVKRPPLQLRVHNTMEQWLTPDGRRSEHL